MTFVHIVSGDVWVRGAGEVWRGPDEAGVNLLCYVVIRRLLWCCSDSELASCRMRELCGSVELSKSADALGCMSD